MQTRRTAVAVVAVAAIIGLAGCGPKSSSTASGGAAAEATSAAPAAPPSPVTPESEFQSAVTQLGDQPVKLDMSLVGGITMSGGIDAAARKANFTTDMGQLGRMDIRQVGADMYVKASGQLGSIVGGQTGKWMHIDTTKVPENSPLNVKNNDPKSTAKMLAASTEVSKTGEHKFAGKVDLTKSPTFNSSAAKGLAGKMSAVPFTAEVNDQGQLTELVFDLQSVASGAGSMTTKYSDYGKPVDVTAPPASDVIEMPEKFRKAMGA
jgi:hypothetical protein